MAKMKIRGGDLDLVEYEFQPFLPGECIHTLGFEGEYKLTPCRARTSATAAWCFASPEWLAQRSAS